MSRFSRFSMGGLGGLLPIMASLLAVDLTAFAAIIDRGEGVSPGICVGYVIRILILVTLGGIMALLNTEIQHPLALVQIGIAAPALVTSFVTGAAITKADRASSRAFSIVGSAWAAESSDQQSLQVAGLISDIRKGLEPGLGNLRDKEERPNSTDNPKAHSVTRRANGQCFMVTDTLERLRSSFPSSEFNVSSTPCSK